MTQKTELKQRQFRHDCHQNQQFIEHLNGQCQQLGRVEVAMSEGDLTEIHTRVSELDFHLIRYACFFLGWRTDEAAKHDCAELLAESALDTSEKGGGDRRENWLDAAPCWPLLAKGKWPYAVSKAAEIIVQRLEAAGVNVNGVAVDEIEEAVSRMKLADLMLPAVFERFFPASTDDEGEPGG